MLLPCHPQSPATLFNLICVLAEPSEGSNCVLSDPSEGARLSCQRSCFLVLDLILASGNQPYPSQADEIQVDRALVLGVAGKREQVNPYCEFILSTV